MSVLIAARALSAGYERRAVIREVDLEVRRGEIVALLGANGSGKTTLLRVLAGELTPLHGCVETSGRVALVEPAAPPPDVDAFDLVSYAVLAREPWWRLTPSADARAAVELALSRVDLARHAHRSLASSSAGEAQRAWIAAALAVECDALLVDEPTSHLDVRYQVEVARTLRRVSRDDRAIVVAMHELALAAAFADRVALFEDGRVTVGAPADILTEERLSSAYGTRIEIVRHPTTGLPLFAPSLSHVTGSTSP